LVLAFCRIIVFKRGGDCIGKSVGIAGEHLSGGQMGAAFTKVLGREVRYNDVPVEVFRGLGFPGAEEFGNMFQFMRDFNEVFCGARSLAVSRALNSELQTFEAWLTRNKSRLPIE
jgi:hypothetical protein